MSLENLLASLKTEGARVTTLAQPPTKTAPPALDPDLHRRILEMAERWGYSGDDLAIALRDAALNPAGWLLTVTCDETGDWGAAS